MIGHKEAIRIAIEQAEDYTIEALKQFTAKENYCRSIDVYWYVRNKSVCKISSVDGAIKRIVRMLKEAGVLQVRKRGQHPALYIVDREMLIANY